MAPKTSQGPSKPKALSNGGPTPHTGIPAPASVLQRRSFMPAPSSLTGTKSLQNMPLEHQSLLAEAISIHNPGLIDLNRKRAESVGSVGSVGSDSTSRTQHQQSPLSTAYSTGATNHSNNSTAVHASSLSYKSSQARRTSTSHSSASPEGSPYGQSGNIRATNAAYSAIAPLTTAALQQSASSTSSPTADSPSGPRPVRLSGSINTARLSKQALSQRPPSASSSISSPTRNGQQGSTNGPENLGSPVQNHSQFPASLDGIELGDRVVVESMGLSGYLRFVGTAEFKTGLWAGIELDTPTGKNDGSVNGVVYFTCRPNCGIFVLAAKIVKTELLLPFLPSSADSARPPSAQEDTQTPPPPPINHAAQAAARITAGSRASKYIGVTASQLKQRNVMPQPSNSRLPPQQQQQQSNDHNNTTKSTISSVPLNSHTTSPTPTGRTTLGNRLSQPGTKVSPSSQTIRAGIRSGSIPTSPSTIANRPRTSPTPGRLVSSPRRLSSRNSDNSDGNTSNSVISPNLLDQATLVQMAESPQDNLATQLQQLQLDFGVAIAENNMLKTEMNQTKTQLEMTRLLEKRDLSYDERTFLSKSLGRGGIEERLGQELEELHAMKAEWEKEKAAKDSEIKGVTEKMTQAWLDAARSQKEKTALIQERDELLEKLKEIQENGSSSGLATEDQQTLIDSLKKDINDADKRILELETQVQDLGDKSMTDEARVRAVEEALVATQSDYTERLNLLELERDDLQVRLDDLEDILKVSTDALRSKLEAALRDAAHSEEQLHEVQARLEHESELRRTKESEAETKAKHAEVELSESQSLLAKSEKLVRVLEEKAKDYESSIAKREQEIVDLKAELEDLAGMVQSDEVDRMRKVWENEKKRLEEAVADDIAVITGLRSEIQTLEMNESELQAKIKELETTFAAVNTSKSDLELEVSRLKDLSADAQEQFDRERSDLQAKITESENVFNSYETETKAKIQDLQEAVQTVESWKEQYEAMQLEMAQKTAKVEGLGLELVETQSQRDALMQRAEASEKAIEIMKSQLIDLEKTKADYEAMQDEKSQLLSKISELEAALVLSASAPVKTPSAATVDTSKDDKYLELEEEIAHHKKMIHDLTRENIAVGSENKKLMQEHDNLMEAHKHVETECLKLMDEVERLHSESLAAASLVAETEVITQARGTADHSSDVSVTQSQSVIRLEGLLKEKQALLDRLTQSHASEMRDLRQRYVDLDRSKSYEIGQLNKELTELETLIESKIFHEADLEEEVQRKQKQIDRLQYEITDLKSALGLSNGTHAAPPQSTNSNLRGEYRTSTASSVTQRTPASSAGKSQPSGPEDDQALFCEICETEGHDIISCTAVFGSKNIPKGNAFSANSYNVAQDNKPYCENCEEYGLHYTEECPNESLTY